MAKERTSVRMQAQIKKMAAEGYSLRSMSRILRLSRKTIRKYLDTTLREASPPVPWIRTVDWEYVRKEVYGEGTTIKQIHVVSDNYTSLVTANRLPH